MARVSRMTAARSSGAGGGIGGGGSMSGSLTASQRGASLAGGGGKIDPTLSLYPSINTLRSEQEDDDLSYKDCCKTALRCLYDYTIASCIYSACQYIFRRNNNRLKHIESTTSVEDMEVSEMKEKLKFHFMNPFQKWRYEPRRRFPWKLIVQLTSMFLVTLQLVLFAQTKFALTDFIRENTGTFVNLFVAKPVDSFGQTDPIPSPIAYLYTMEDVLNQINFTSTAYFDLRKGAVGTYGYEWVDHPDNEDWENRSKRCLELNVTRYEGGKIDPTNKTFTVKGKTTIKNYTIYAEDVSGNDPNRSLSQAIDWDKLVDDMNVIKTFTLQFKISSIYIDHVSTKKPRAICFQFILLFTIKNEYRTGNMPVTLKVDTVKSDCREESTVFQLGTSFDNSNWIAALDGVVIFISIVSLVQCVRSLVNSWHLAVIVRRFFKSKFDNFRLKFRQLVPLFNLWHVGVISSNALVIVGSILKLLISYNIINNIEVVDITSIILGLAVFGQWCGLLRFLSYFDKYNMLLLTLRISAPSVLRFIICTGILYIAFLLCGWLVLGPYHPKFSDLSTASECLFSLVNGDDMFNTYAMMSESSQAAWIFSKIYLYIFIALFIYVVLSVFISLISDTYETLHEHWRDRSKGLLEDFATGKLGRAHAHSHHHHAHTHSLTSIVNEDEDYDLLRDITQTGYGSSEHTPLIVNGGPELSKTPPRHQHLLPTPPTLRKAGQSSINNSDNFSEDEGVGPGNSGPAQSVFKLDN